MTFRLASLHDTTAEGTPGTIAFLLPSTGVQCECFGHPSGCASGCTEGEGGDVGRGAACEPGPVQADSTSVMHAKRVAVERARTGVIVTPRSCDFSGSASSSHHRMVQATSTTT